MAEQIHILLVEDNKGDYVLTREMLTDIEQSVSSKDIRFQLTWAERLTLGIEHISKQRFDVILLDLSLPDAHGLDGFYILRAVAPNAPILVLTGNDDQTAALNAVHAGAQDYLVKGKLDSNVLGRAIRYAIERYRTLKDLENAKESSERANRAKTELLVAIADELGSPLKSIVRMAKSAVEGELSFEQKERIDGIRTTAQSQLKLLTYVHDFSQIEASALTLRSGDVKIRDYLAQVVAMMELHAKEAGAALTYTIDTRVPNRLLGDIDRLGQVVTNLMENAIRFGASDRTRMRQIELQCKVDSIAKEEALLHFSVGLLNFGIPIEEQRLIFESFAQADASTLRKFGSTGLGLAVSSKLVGLMGGRAWVESEANKGTVFHFTVKFFVPSEAQNRETQASAIPATAKS